MLGSRRMTSAASSSPGTGRHYGAFAFATMVISCYAGYFFYSPRFFTGEAMVPVTFALGAVYAALGVFSSSSVDGKRGCAGPGYFVTQTAVLTALIFLSPVRGFFGIIVLPLISQAIFDLRPRYSTVLAIYLFTINIAIWWIPFGWNSGVQAMVSYSAGFVFTILFSIITRQALKARELEERLRQEVETANQQLRAYAEQAGDLATTRERNRLAREIHDGLGHYLTVVKTQLDAAAALIPTRPQEAREAVVKAAKLTSDALDDVRRSVGALRTDAVRPPLPEALRLLGAESGLPVTVRTEGETRVLPPGVEHALFRSAQEALTNVRKHAGASAAEVVLDFRTNGRVTLAVTDNGRGMGAAPATGFGLRGMAERIEVLGGTVDTSRRDSGFALTIEVPA